MLTTDYKSPFSTNHIGDLHRIRKIVISESICAVELLRREEALSLGRYRCTCCLSQQQRQQQQQQQQRQQQRRQQQQQQRQQQQQQLQEVMRWKSYDLELCVSFFIISNSFHRSYFRRGSASSYPVEAIFHNPSSLF